jgi:hypothetical protein
MPKARKDDKGRVIPYLSVDMNDANKPSNCNNAPDALSLDVFQCWGGGHYQALFLE